MLTVYTEESLITNDLQLMCFNDNYFRLNFINRKHPYDETILNLIRTIDGAQQVEGKNKDKFYSKFGGEIAVDALSTGCKTAINIYITYCLRHDIRNICFSTLECGNNALLEIVKFPNGIVYMPIWAFDTDNFKTDCPVVTLDGTFHASNLFELIDIRKEHG